MILCERDLGGWKPMAGEKQTRQADRAYVRSSLREKEGDQPLGTGTVEEDRETERDKLRERYREKKRNKR